MGIRGTSLNPSFAQVIRIHSCIENKYLQVHRDLFNCSYFPGPWSPGSPPAVCWPNVPGIALCFLLHQALTGCEELLDSRIPNTRFFSAGSPSYISLRSGLAELVV